MVPRGVIAGWNPVMATNWVASIAFRQPRSARLVRVGKTFSLSIPLDEPGTGGEERPTFEHRMIRFRNGRDDALDNFYMSSSSQWDGLRHVRLRKHGYYGGRDEEALKSKDVLGIQRVAERGIVTRGVLLDLPRFMQATGQRWDPRERRKIGPDDLDACLQHQSVAPKSAMWCFFEPAGSRIGSAGQRSSDNKDRIATGPRPGAAYGGTALESW